MSSTVGLTNVEQPENWTQKINLQMLALGVQGVLLVRRVSYDRNGIGVKPKKNAPQNHPLPKLIPPFSKGVT